MVFVLFLSHISHLRTLLLNITFATLSLSSEDLMMAEANGGRTSFKLFGAVILKEEKKHRGAHENEEQTEVATPSPAPATETVEEAAARAAAAAALPCPRCMSMETKFCYFNNYNVNQPRHFCKACHRYWTAGGTLRNVPVGAGRRRGRLSTLRGGAAALAAAAGAGAAVLEYATAAECLGGQQRWLLQTEAPMARSDRGFGAGLR